MLEILWQGVEAEILGDAGHAPGFRAGFERAQHHLAGIGLVIGAFVGDAQHRKVAKAFDGFCYKIEMLAGVERQAHAGPRGQVAAPHATAVDDDVRRDVTGLAVRLPIDAGDALAVVCHGRDLHALHDPCAAHPRALGQRHGDIGRVALPVAGKMHGAGDIADLHMRIHGLDLGGGNLAHLHVEGAGERGLPQKLFAPVGGQANGDGAHLPHPRGDAGLFLELDVEIGGILGQPRHVLSAAQLPHQTGGVPGCAAGQLLAFQQDDVGPAQFRQMIRDRTAGDAATDDDGAGLRGEVGHGVRPSAGRCPGPRGGRRAARWRGGVRRRYRPPAHGRAPPDPRAACRARWSFPRGSPMRPMSSRPPRRRHARASTCRGASAAPASTVSVTKRFVTPRCFSARSAALPGKSCGLSKRMNRSSPPSSRL